PGLLLQPVPGGDVRGGDRGGHLIGQPGRKGDGDARVARDEVRPTAGFAKSAHAVTDALLGAAGLGDIGEHFPDTDPQWKGVDSLILLRQAAALVRGAGYRIGNVDCSVVCEAPKLAPHKQAMQARLSEAAGAPVTVKGRRAEGLGALGRQEGIAVWAVAVITKAKMSGNEGAP
ncbi:MAG: 2-C-methyl-D-erythritol 2,4-cyclodiphosphate synthase, partial [Actinomycetota bacterium]